MSKVEIIGLARSSYTRVVRMVCEEKGIDYDDPAADAATAVQAGLISIRTESETV